MMLPLCCRRIMGTTNLHRLYTPFFDDQTIERLLKIQWWDFPDEVIRENVKLFSEKMDEPVLNKLEEIRYELDHC